MWVDDSGPPIGLVLQGGAAFWGRTGYGVRVYLQPATAGSSKEQGAGVLSFLKWVVGEHRHGRGRGGGQARQDAQGKTRRGRKTDGRHRTGHGRRKQGWHAASVCECVVMRCNACQTRGNGSQSSVGRKRRPHRRRLLGSAGLWRMEGMTDCLGVNSHRPGPPRRLVTEAVVRQQSLDSIDSSFIARWPNCLTRSLGSFAPLSSPATIHGLLPSIDRRPPLTIHLSLSLYSGKVWVSPSIWPELWSKLSRPQLETNGPSRLLETGHQLACLHDIHHTGRSREQQCASCQYVVYRGSTPSASSEGFWALEANPRQIWGRFCHRVAQSRGVCGDFGEDLGCFCRAWLAWLMTGRQTGRPVPEGVKVQGSKPTPRGQAGPKRAIGTPQNKAMVRPNPIDRPQSTRRYPGPSQHAHWLGFSGVARPAELWVCGFVVGAGVLECLITRKVSLWSPCYSSLPQYAYHILGSQQSRGRALRTACSPRTGREKAFVCQALSHCSNLWQFWSPLAG